MTRHFTEEEGENKHRDKEGFWVMLDDDGAEKRKAGNVVLWE